MTTRVNISYVDGNNAAEVLVINGGHERIAGTLSKTGDEVSEYIHSSQAIVVREVIAPEVQPATEADTNEA